MSNTQKRPNVYRVIGAAHWASYLINGDASGLDERELTLANEWLERELGPNDTIASCDDEGYFSWSYGLHTGDRTCSGGEVLAYDVISYR